MSTIAIDEKYDKCRHLLKESIGKKRYLHSIGVSNTAACLAMKYEEDIKRSALAGLLHDCAKGLEKEELIKTVLRAGISISPIEEDNPDLLHSKAGSVIAREKYGIDDEEILSAIFFHTTGKPNMTFLEKNIFLSDCIEPNRGGIPGIDGIRSMAFTDIDKAVTMACLGTIEHLKRDSLQMDPITLETYKYYKELSGYDEYKRR